MNNKIAKPSFLGKTVYYLPECHSTNDELSGLVKKNSLKEGTVIYTDFQSKGKGQRGNKWIAGSGKNLLMSLLLLPENLSVQNQYYLNLTVGLAAVETIESLIGEPVCLKWPNDIYIGRNKIGGILTETSIKLSCIESAIIGIGLNINQDDIPVPKSTSLLLESNRFHQVMDVMELLLCKMEKWYEALQQERLDTIIEAYYSKLMWLNKWHKFQSDGKRFNGKIKGIDNYGRLMIELEHNIRQTFNLKEVEFIDL